MHYLPLTEDDRREMLAVIGVDGLEGLLAPVPESVRLGRALDLPPPMAQADLAARLSDLARQNAPAQGWLSFLGGGIYDHFIPPALDQIAGRSEYYTAYTPYQPEVAQGTLRATFEFQSMICRLTGMDVANASLYDGAMALVEAIHLAVGKTKRHHAVISASVNPRWRRVLDTFARPRGIEITTVGLSSDTGTTPPVAMRNAVNDRTAAVAVASPNYCGLIEETPPMARIAHNAGAMMIECFSPIGLGLLRPPGSSGADIAVGEGQPLGNPPSFGGPLLGLFAVRSDDIRRLPGRLVAKTVDRDDRTAYVMALQTREQHIRRERATSNVCTAQALLATRAAIYLALLGKTGFRLLAETCLRRAHHLADTIAALPGFSITLGRRFFNEFVVQTPIPAREIVETLRERRIQPGIDLGRHYPGWDNRLLICVTEKHSPAMLKQLTDALAPFGAANTVTASNPEPAQTS